MSLRGDTIKLKDELDNGNIPFYKEGERNFLDLIDPLNKKGVFKDYVAYLEGIINDDRFGQLSKSRQNEIKKELRLIKQEGESQIEEILEDYGISFKNAKQIRSVLKQGFNYEPVLVLNPDTGIAEWDITHIGNLTPKAKATNAYETFRIYGENGFPQTINIKGIPERYDMMEMLEEQEQLSMMEMLGWGTDYDKLESDKKKFIDQKVKENLEGIETVGMKYYYHFPNGNIVVIDKSTGNRAEQNPQNGTKIPFKNPITQEDDFQTEIIYNPRTKELYDRKQELVTNSYRQLLKKETLEHNDKKWIRKQIEEKKSFNQIMDEITNLPGYMILQEAGQAMSFEKPEVLEQARQQPRAMMTPVSQGKTPVSPRPIGFGGPGTLPQASMQRPGIGTEREGGISSLAGVRNIFKQMRVG